MSEILFLKSRTWSTPLLQKTSPEGLIKVFCFHSILPEYSLAVRINHTHESVHYLSSLRRRRGEDLIWVTVVTQSHRPYGCLSHGLPEAAMLITEDKCHLTPEWQMVFLGLCTGLLPKLGTSTTNIFASPSVGLRGTKKVMMCQGPLYEMLPTSSCFVPWVDPCPRLWLTANFNTLKDISYTIVWRARCTNNR